jgi:hypothetical protein
MARTLTFTGELSWPIEDGKQAAKVALSASLVYTSALHIEKVYATTVMDEAVDLPMTSAKFLLLQASGTENISVKLNGSAQAIVLKAGSGFILVQNPDGAITGLTVTVAAQPATLKGFAFA